MLIFGLSLIAVMLGRLRMDVDLCIHEYRILSPDIYKPHSGFLRFTINPDRGRAEVLEKTLRARRSLQPFEYFRQSDENQCRT